MPKTIRVQSAGPRGKIWESLSLNDKQLVFHLTEAANAGHALLYHQSHRRSLAIKHLLEEALSTNNLADTKALLGEKPFAELLRYAAKFFDQSGPYAPSNRKYVLVEVKPEQMARLAERFMPNDEARASGDIVRLLTDPKFEVQQYPENQQGDGLENTGSNYYEHGITGKEVHAAFDKTAKLTLNGRVERSPSGLVCVPQTTKSPGLVGEHLRKVVAHLRPLLFFSKTPQQQAQINAHKVFQRGDVEDFRRASIAWVRDRGPRVDFMLAGSEFDGDWLSQMASWNRTCRSSIEISKLAQGLAGTRNTSKTACPGIQEALSGRYAPPAIMVYYFQEIAGLRSERLQPAQLRRHSPRRGRQERESGSHAR